ncbi:hypothetical protein BDZ94DRAFT_157835 [Collybia nuda]|uniref:Integral membrane protein n=1 Tax=Collybia nuda TaxID=64659 RepID=A0A9P6CD98_9AGAR|nr:hypothetical protein BDZ94DRAFT_157835 [Collybia nuda]
MQKSQAVVKGRTLSARWHHHLHPSAQKHNPRNGLPHCLEDLVHPTHAHLTKSDDGDLAWTSRDHRKNRHVPASPKSGNARLGTTVLQRFGHLGRIEYWNISWWVAIAFTLGSVVWVINGFVAFLPEVDPDMKEMDASSGWTAFVGATIFEIGSVFGILEAWNRDDAANFGWSLEKAFRHKPGDEQGLTIVGSSHSETGSQQIKPTRQWIWFSLDGKYWHELGFLAAFSQLCAATIFWISGFTAIPTIQSAIKSNSGLLDGVFWTPQVIGGSGFIISATFIMLETQEKWYKLSPLNLGWQVGFWNMIGAIGFTLSGALGYAAETSSGAAYQSALSTFWGGWAFLFGSVIQWYESVNSI